MNGIYYTKGDMFIMVGPEDLDPEDRSYFTHVEFWSDDKKITKDPIFDWTHKNLLSLARQFKSGGAFMSDLVGLVPN